MKELSLHILDISQNSITAGASCVKLTIEEDIGVDTMVVTIEDNGSGIPKEKLEDITNPFVTSRKTRKVGMGLSLLQAAAVACNGGLIIESEEEVGTRVSVSFKHSHIDRAPLGDMGNTIMTMLLSFNDADLIYRHCYNGKEFVFDTREIKEILGEPDLIGDVEVLNWIKEFVNEGIQGIMEE